MEAAFCRAVRVTLVGSITPAATNFVPLGLCVETEIQLLALAHLLDHYGAFVPCIEGDLAQRFLKSAADDDRTDGLVSLEFQPVYGRDATDKSDAATGNDTFLDRSAGGTNASSTRAFFSFISVSVAAPTLITATPPASLARRSCSFRGRSRRWCRRSAGGSVDTALDVLCLPPPQRSWCYPCRSILFLAAQVIQPWVFEFEAKVLEDPRPPVSTPRVPSMALRRSPNPGALTAAAFNVPRSLFTTRSPALRPRYLRQ